MDNKKDTPVERPSVNVQYVCNYVLIFVGALVIAMGALVHKDGFVEAQVCVVGLGVVLMFFGINHVLKTMTGRSIINRIAPPLGHNIPPDYDEEFDQE